MGSGVDCSTRKSAAGSPVLGYAMAVKNNIIQDLLLLNF